MAAFVLALVFALLSPQLPDAATLLKQQNGGAQKYRTLHTVTEMTMEVSQENGPAIKTTIGATLDRALPAKSRMEMKGGFTVVSDGDVMWMYYPAARQYTKTAAVPSPTGLPGMGMPAGGIAMPDVAALQDSLFRNARTLSETTLDIDGRPRPCWVVELRPDLSAIPSLRNSPLADGVITLWIDKEIGISLQYEMSFTMAVPRQNTSARMVMRSTTTSLQIDEPLADSLFTFVPPADAKEVSTLFTPPGAPTGNLTGTNAPPFDVRTLDGATYSLSSLKGKPVLLDFWATWCGPCRQAMPYLDAVNRDYASQGLVVLGVDAGEDRQTVERFLMTTPASYQTVLGVESDIVSSFKVTAYPTYVLIDPAGKIVAQEVGFPGDSRLRAMLTKAGLTAVAPTTPAPSANRPAPAPIAPTSSSRDVAARPILPSDRTDPTLRAPTLVSPPDGSVFDIYPRMTTVRWNPSAGAASYVVEWDFSSGGAWFSEREPNATGHTFATSGTDLTFAFVGAQPGRWRVWPVNAAGERGTPSEWRTFRYTR